MYIVLTTILFLLFFGYATQHVGYYFLDQGLNPCFLHWKHRVLTSGPPGKSLKYLSTPTAKVLFEVMFILRVENQEVKIEYRF